MSIDFNSSKTKTNLMRAFAGESQARNRYTLAEKQAKQQKLYVLADLFKFTANQEKIHAGVFYDHLTDCAGQTIEINGGYPVDISANTLDLLKMASHNENEEFDDVYPSFAQVARDEGFAKIAQDFTNIAKIEKHTQAPKVCPVCSVEQGYFIRLNMTPWTCRNQ